MSYEIKTPELGTIGLLRWLWRQLTSMRTALILLLLLGVASIPGSIIPQRNQDPTQVQQYFADSPTLAKVFDKLSLFNLYSSTWFSAIYLLLFISLIGCVLPRTWEHFKNISALPPQTPKNLIRLEEFRSFESQKNADEILDIARSHFGKRRYRIRDCESSVAVEKGFIRESGNLLFHLSLIGILIGVSAGVLGGMRGSAIVNEGESFTNVATSYDTLSAGRFFKLSDFPPVSLKVVKFTAVYDPRTNAPLDYSLIVDVTESGKSNSRRLEVKVNKPLTFGSTRVYLQANGFSPKVTVRDNTGKIVLSGAIPFLPQDGNLSSIGAIKVPDLTPTQLGIVGSFLPTADRDKIRGGFSSYPEALNPRLLMAAWLGDLGLDTGVPQSVYRINTKNMERVGLKSLAPGEVWTIPGNSSTADVSGTITFDGVTKWVNLQIVRDPGKPFALLGAVFALLGLLISLFARRRRIWIRTVLGENASSSGVIVEIAGLSRSPGLDQEIDDLVKVLKEKKGDDE
jgi:cytochrome c biogenesis protein